jgi:electron transfer flavoprotein beta subunit
MHIVVCVKLIPDPAIPSALDPTTHRLVRSAKTLLDEADSFGVEQALQLVEAAGQGSVTVVTMAASDEGIQTALAMGADKAIVVTDDALANSDALSTAKVLAAAIKRQEVDLVIAATESTDGYAGVMPQQLAELLDLPSITFAKQVAVEAGVVSVQRQTESGFDDVTCPLPALVTVTAGVVEPRYPSFKGIMAAKSKPREVLSLADLGLATTDVGGASGQRIASVTPAQSRASGTVIEDDGSAPQQIVDFLTQLKVI